MGYGKVGLVDTVCVLCLIRGRFRDEVGVNEKISHGKFSIVAKEKYIYCGM